VPSEQTDEIRSLMNKSDKQIFLGFAFHKINIILLRPRSASNNPIRRIFATAMRYLQVTLEQLRTNCQLVT